MLGNRGTPIAFLDYECPKRAFDNAISEGRLSTDETADNYAGNFMYMGTSREAGEVPISSGKRRDLFKNVNTRKYLP